MAADQMRYDVDAEDRAVFALRGCFGSDDRGERRAVWTSAIILVPDTQTDTCVTPRPTGNRPCNPTPT